MKERTSQQQKLRIEIKIEWHCGSSHESKIIALLFAIAPIALEFAKAAIIHFILRK